MDSSLASAMCSQRVPDKCPFCDLQGISWTEFRIHETDVHYFDWENKPNRDAKVRDEYIKVFCSRCEEEIREEDL